MYALFIINIIKKQNLCLYIGLIILSLDGIKLLLNSLFKIYGYGYLFIKLVL